MYRLDYAAGLDTEGPLGFKMKDKAASELQTILKAEGLEKEHQYARFVVDEPPQELNKSKRTDVSWISVESPDKQKEVILADGMNFAVIKRNNVVTIDHNLPVIGESLWQKSWAVDEKKGVIAKTRYLEKPDGWNQGDKWIGDAIFNLVVNKAMTGKSVGILPVPSAVRAPTQQEVDANPDWEGAKVYGKSYLVEYAVTRKPVHPEALVLTVTKSMPEDAEDFLAALGVEKKSEPYRKCKVIPAETIGLLVAQHMKGFNPAAFGEEVMKQAIYRKTGKIT